MAGDYYAVLGVTKDATTQEIKKAFRQIARECHPDVAGEDAAAAVRFKQSREAYETLVDPVTRARYDRRGRGGSGGGSFFDAFYRGSDQRGRRTGPSYASHDAGGHADDRRRHKKDHEANDLDLDDLFNGFGDFGFGGGGGGGARSRVDPRAGKQGRERPPQPEPEAPRRSSAPPPRSEPRGSWGDPGAWDDPTAQPWRDPPRQDPPPRDEARPPMPEPGGDVNIELEVPERVARSSGTVTATYYRMKRSDSWRPGQSGTGLVRVQDIADVRIMPGTVDGAVLRERGLGDAGPYGGPYGDLVVRVRIRPEVREEPRREEPRQEERAPPPPLEPQRTTLDIGPAEAMLGARVAFTTPAGRVTLAIPPGSSSGRVLRLRNRGERGADLLVELRIVVPEALDAESRRLIERFAELNPPRR